VDIPHHTSKGATDARDANKARGASAMKDAARLVYTLTPMTTQEAELFGVPDEDRRSMVRLDSAKVNIAPPSREAKWFRIVGQELGNGTERYPKGDEVQTVWPWEPPSVWDGMKSDIIDACLDDIDAGIPNERSKKRQRYSAARSAKRRAAWKVVQKHCPDKTEQQCRELIRHWLKNGVLFEKQYYDEIESREESGLFVNERKGDAE
jgi:hypothetical protein